MNQSEMERGAGSSANEDKDEVTKEILEKSQQESSQQRKEVGGPSGPEPTRFGDWERKGQCIDF